MHRIFTLTQAGRLSRAVDCRGNTTAPEACARPAGKG